MKGKKIKKLIASIISILLISVIVFFFNAIFGNPVSKMAAEKTAQKHIAQAYPDSDYKVENAYFDFKSTNYNVNIISPSSIDSKFTLICDMMGNLLADSYKDSVIERGNTSLRIGFAYREAADAVFESNRFPFETHISFGDIEFVPAQYKNDPSIPEYALISNELTLDMDFDVNDFGKKAGHLTVYAYDKTVTSERLAEMLIDLRSVFDESELSFYAVDFVLEYPQNEDGTQKEGRVEVMGFLYKDIYEKDLVERVEKSNEKAIEYYEQQDAEKLEEMNSVE